MSGEQKARALTTISDGEREIALCQHFDIERCKQFSQNSPQQKKKIGSLSKNGNREESLTYPYKLCAATRSCSSIHNLSLAL